LSTATVAVPANSWLRPKYLLAALLGLISAYVLVHNESFLLDSQHPAWQHIHPFRWYLLPHGIAGACALLLAPLQFSDRLRQRFRKLHRITGRIYVGAVLIAAPLGFYIQFFKERMGEPRTFSAAAATQAALWLATTLIAFALILQGKVDAHRRWMTRSFSSALVFVYVRLLLGVTGWETLGPGVVEASVWGCNVFAIFAADIVLQWQELARSPIRSVAR
jgi:uncharacterized membrane protein